MASSILFHEYKLFPKTQLNARSSSNPRIGAILCIDSGYADLHPWPEFGDLPLHSQLSILKSGELTPLLEQALDFASIDRQYRSQGKSAFEGLTVPKSHTLVTNINELSSKASSAISQTFKIKIGINPDAEAEILNSVTSNVTFRLDANESFSKKTFLSFWNSLSDHTRANIEFVEDPFPPLEGWDSVPYIPFALDKANAPQSTLSYSYRIIKPASQKYEKIAHFETQRNKKIVITSSMDHPLGQVASAWCAAQVMKEHPDALSLCGLLSHTAYEDNDFSEELFVNDNILTPPRGTGFGFDQALRSINWKKIG